MIDGLPNPPVRFEQDPDYPEGTGTFHFQDGSSLYAHEPDLASAVLERSKPPAGGGPDEPFRVADNSFDALDKAGGYGPQTASDVSGRAALFAGASDANSHAAPAGPMPGGYGNTAGGVLQPTRSGKPIAPPPAAPGAPPDARGAELLHQALAAGMGQPAPGPAQPQRPWVPGSRGGVTPVTQETTQETQGAPYSLEDAAMREEANRHVAGAQLAVFDAQRAEAEQRAAAADAAVPALRYKAAEGQSALAKLEGDYKVERARVRTIISEHDKNAKVDPDRFYTKKGTAGVVGMIIGQALGAFGAAIGHHENYAQKLIDDEHDREMRAQEDEIRANQVSDGNLLAQLNDQLGDLQQAKAAFQLVQGELTDRQIQSFAEHAKSADAQRQAALWLAQNQQNRLKLEQEFHDRSIGKQTVKTEAKITPATSGHPMTDAELEAWQTKENKRKAGLLESENELAYQRTGGEQAGKIAKRDAGKGISPRLQSTIVAAKNARDAIGEIAGTLGMQRDKSGEYEDPGALDTVWAKVPFTDAHQQFSAARNSLVAEVGKAQTGGVLSEGEAEQLRKQIDGLHTPGQLGAFVRHYDGMMRAVEQNVRDVAASSGRPGADTGGEP